MLAPEPGTTPSPAARQVAAMLAAQAGVALARDAGRLPVEA
ncbi:hypothetical protein [Catenulispora rubra]|nr:hypothetical protein [Catenulispora rubra]